MSDLSFGALLRGWRGRLDPADAGLRPVAAPPGLRREELAVLASLSVEYVLRLEQGRATNPSAQVVSRHKTRRRNSSLGYLSPADHARVVWHDQ